MPSPVVRATSDDCHDDHTAMFNMAYDLAANLMLPLPALWLGDVVTVTAINAERSSLCQGIQANIVGENKTVPLIELNFLDPDRVSKYWLDRYRHWLLQS
jgi:hypothetical protein